MPNNIYRCDRFNTNVYLNIIYRYNHINSPALTQYKREVDAFRTQLYACTLHTRTHTQLHRELDAPNKLHTTNYEEIAHLRVTNFRAKKIERRDRVARTLRMVAMMPYVFTCTRVYKHWKRDDSIISRNTSVRHIHTWISMFERMEYCLSSWNHIGIPMWITWKWDCLHFKPLALWDWYYSLS